MHANYSTGRNGGIVQADEPPKRWVIQRLGDRWAAGYTYAHTWQGGFHHKFDTLAEAEAQVNWQPLRDCDSVTYQDEAGRPLPVTDYL
jgi:hypothetical protein